MRKNFINIKVFVGILSALFAVQVMAQVSGVANQATSGVASVPATTEAIPAVVGGAVSAAATINTIGAPGTANGSTPSGTAPAGTTPGAKSETTTTGTTGGPGFMTSGFGGVADNLMTPVTVLSDFMNGTALVIGISCLFASFVKYLEYRRNSMATPISRAILLLIVGIVLTCLPFVSHLTESGIPFSLHL